MLRYAVFLGLCVLSSSVAGAKTLEERLQHREEFAKAVVAFGKVVEKRMGADFKGDYPKTKFLWTREEVRKYPLAWLASYDYHRKEITIGVEIEQCDPRLLLKKSNRKMANKRCAKLQRLIAHEYGHHYLHLKVQEKLGWLTPSDPFSILRLWNWIVYGEQSLFAYLV